MSLWLIFTLLSLATFRVTRLIARDDFPPIVWIRTKIYLYRATYSPTMKQWNPRWWGELITCTWCVSAYVSAGTVCTVWSMIGLPMPVLWWLAVWGAAAYLAKFAS